MPRVSGSTNQKIGFDVEPCGRHMVSGGTDGVLRAYDLRDGAEIAAWRAGRLIVRGETLAEVVETLDRYHPGVIVIADARLGQARITGNFDLRHPAEALDAAVRTRKGAVTRVTPYVAVVRGR